MAFWEIVVEGRQGSKDMLNVFHYTDGGGVAPDFTQVATVFQGHIQDHLQAVCGSRVSWLGITAREDTLGAVGTFYAFPGGTIVGTQSNPDQIDVVAMQVRKLSQGLIKPTRGWFMQGGITVQGVGNDNRWGSTVTDAVQAYADDIRVLNLVNGAVLTMVIKATNPSAPNTQPYSTVAAFTIAGQPKTQ